MFLKHARGKSRTKRNVLGFTLLLLAALGPDASACTSFKLATDHGLYFAHSLNQGSVPGVPGLIFINQRNTWKNGYSWEKLVQVHDTSGPGLVWQSTYGSVTFNPFGKELPDGGMNEAGLFIWEMGFDTEYPDEEFQPTLFQGQWMQYVLDNFSTTGEVIANAARMNLDGWGWHYFIADTSGGTAIIDFVGGKPVVYTGADMPVPLCCNSVYPEAVNWLKQHQGFGGELEITKIQEEIPRFIYGAKLLQEYTTQDPVEYSSHVLDEMSPNVRWAVVFDVAQRTVYYNTNLNQDIGQFSFTSEDFGRTDGPLIVDIENPGRHDVRERFVSYDAAMNTHLLSQVFTMLCVMEPAFHQMLLVDQGVDAAGLAASVTAKLGNSATAMGYPLDGTWTGRVQYPSGDEAIDLPLTLVLARDNGSWSGTVDDGENINNLPLTNIVYHGGLLQFTVKPPDTDDLFYYHLYLSGTDLTGALDICGKTRQAAIQLAR